MDTPLGTCACLGGEESALFAYSWLRETSVESDEHHSHLCLPLLFLLFHQEFLCVPSPSSRLCLSVGPDHLWSIPGRACCPPPPCCHPLPLTECDRLFITSVSSPLPPSVLRTTCVSFSLGIFSIPHALLVALAEDTLVSTLKEILTVYEGSERMVVVASTRIFTDTALREECHSLFLQSQFSILVHLLFAPEPVILSWCCHRDLWVLCKLLQQLTDSGKEYVCFCALSLSFIYVLNG